jgi:N utilization substance protein B|tara:strand:- start:18 stop:524 length:507 start_codon:yes stop_codon:yes gene_type:complete
MKFNLNDLISQYSKVKNADDFPEDKVRYTDDKRTEARLLAVQAVFTSLNEEKSTTGLINESLEYCGLKSAHLDKKLFAKVAENALNNKDNAIEEITLNLNETWTFARVEQITAAILITAIAELLAKETAVEILVSEYMSLANAFVEEDQAKFIHGVLASVIKKYNLAV